ncbi:hypothetical protein [Streptomyces sp. CAU 1734]|uniref:hypothetical protein n=1 Tax=Streptomyces sp. CAU 1734 TaxID=3140360 RepID=UPI00325FDFFD
MAWICPRCERPEAVAFVENEKGLYPFPCLFCEHSIRFGTALGTETVSSRCTTRQCGAAVTDTFAYDAQGRLTDVARRPCPHCRAAPAAGRAGGHPAHSGHRGSSESPSQRPPEPLRTSAQRAP